MDSDGKSMKQSGHPGHVT